LDGRGPRGTGRADFGVVGLPALRGGGGPLCGHLKIGHIIGQNAGDMNLISFQNAILGFN
jgi:hypothetical protein